MIRNGSSEPYTLRKMRVRNPATVLCGLEPKSQLQVRSDQGVWAPQVKYVNMAEVDIPQETAEVRPKTACDPRIPATPSPAPYPDRRSIRGCRVWWLCPPRMKNTSRREREPRSTAKRTFICSYGAAAPQKPHNPPFGRNPDPVRPLGPQDLVRGDAVDESLPERLLGFDIKPPG